MRRPLLGFAARCCTRRAVVEDATLTNITDELSIRSDPFELFTPRRSLGQPLDWFCLFSPFRERHCSASPVRRYAAAISWVPRRAQSSLVSDCVSA